MNSVPTRGLMMLIGLVFGLIWFLQYFELPYDPFRITTSSTNSTASLNLTPFSTNSSGLNVATVVASSAKTLNGMVGDGRNGVNEFLVESGGNLTNSLGLDFGLENGKNSNNTTLDYDIDTEAELPLKESLETDRDSAIEKAVRDDLRESTETSKTSTNVESSALRKARKSKRRPAAGVPISEMNDMLRKSRASYHSMKPLWPSQADDELLKVNRLIQSTEYTLKKPRIDVNVYRNFSAFTRSYEMMEKTLKIYIYTEGERPIFHQPYLSKIYASEGWFMKQLKESKHFVTKNADKAHLFYLPFSSLILRKTLYVPDSHNRIAMVQYLRNYLRNITATHSFWNRTNGADHFLVACHDWAPAVTDEIMSNCIRAICNTDVKKGFRFDRDVSLPVTYVRDPTNPLRSLGGKPPSQRHILAFFAGNMHGYLRPILLKHWENKDPDMKITGKLTKGTGEMSYSQYMKRSKYCISAKGYEPFTPRVVEAIFYGCVPVILSDDYVPPFFETLNWEAFAVFVLEREIPNLKRILESISEKRYNKMQKRVRQVQKHFIWHVNKPLKYDVFHMILHSLWHTRLLQVGA